MVARAASAEATGHRVVEEAQRLFETEPFDDVTLAAVAIAAGVSVQTVVRRFGTKEALFAATVERRSALVRAERDRSLRGNPTAAISDLYASYERWGDGVLHLLAQEQRSPLIWRACQRGREYHRHWVESVFGPHVERSEKTNSLLMTELVVVTDVYVWRLLRRDLGLRRQEAERAVRDMVTGLLAAASCLPKGVQVSAALTRYSRPGH